MAEKFESAVDALMSNLEKYVSTKTIIGEPIVIKDTIIFPMADVSFGVAAGAFNKDKDGQNNGAGGAGVKMTPSAILVVQNGTSKVINVKDKDSLNKIIDLIPDLIGKISSKSEAPAEGGDEKTGGKKGSVIEILNIDDDDEPKIEDYL